MVDGIGTGKAKTIVAELTELAAVIDKLIARGMGSAVTTPAAAASVALGEEGADERTAGADDPLTGHAVVVTGAMDGRLAELSRTAVNELIERAEGKASSSVPKRTIPRRGRTAD